MKIVKINSIACTSCIIMNKIFDRIKEEYDIDTEEYDYDFDEEEVKKFDVGNILPVFIVLDKDKEIGRITGEKTYEKFKEELDKIIG